MDIDTIFSKLQDKSTFFLLAGPCAIESRDHCLYMAKELKQICDELGIFLIFKSSFDKANRTTLDAYRSVGLEEGLSILQEVKDTFGVPIVTDVHEPGQCDRVAQVADIIQIPAFLCRQTDLLLAAGRTNKIINIKKGQFCNHNTMKYAYDKVLRGTCNNKIILCDRGTMMGYDDLIVDFRNIVLMKQATNALICQDITHSLQQPNRTDHTLGLRELVPTIARAAISVGTDGIFLEVHDNPECALCDSTTQLHLSNLKPLLQELIELRSVYNKYNK
jgi:2-dehydro-3-deoxyphosphooctonate aldolase (KDO 8-P synthase)